MSSRRPGRVDVSTLPRTRETSSAVSQWCSTTGWVPGRTDRFRWVDGSALIQPFQWQYEKNPVTAVRRMRIVLSATAVPSSFGR